MSENNGSGTKAATRVPARMTHMQFFRLCEELRNQRETLTTERPTRAVAAALMAKKLGNQITPNQIEEAQKATGITWTPKSKGTTPTAKHLRSTRILTEAVIYICTQLGIPAPDNVIALREIARNGRAASNGEPTPQDPIPSKS